MGLRNGWGEGDIDVSMACYLNIVAIVAIANKLVWLFFLLAWAFLYASDKVTLAAGYCGRFSVIYASRIETV